MPDRGMPQAGALPNVDVSMVSDPDIRRAFRTVVQVNQHLTARVHQQQQEIEALLQMMLEKHVGSVSEFKRHMLRLQAGDARSERLHTMITGQPIPSATAVPQQKYAAEPEVAEPEVDRPRRYTL